VEVPKNKVDTNLTTSLSSRSDVLVGEQRAQRITAAAGALLSGVLVAGAVLVVPCAEGQVLFNTGPVGATIGQ
jgi:hypothetical protein